jgi:bifunctional enzyme CysN/CysC
MTHTPISTLKKPEILMNSSKTCVVWFTGLSGAGKSTLAAALNTQLLALGKQTCLLDGDVLRKGLNSDLAYSEADRRESMRRVAEVSKLMADSGLIVITALISPFRADRELARQLIGADRFVEVYVNTPLSVCEARDVKGLYRRARIGEVNNMTGITSPYEVPEAPDFIAAGLDCDLDSMIIQLCTLVLSRI